jgi:hypothetical protein
VSKGIARELLLLARNLSLELSEANNGNWEAIVKGYLGAVLFGR